MRDVHQKQRTGDAQTGCTGLTLGATTTGVDGNIKRVVEIREREWRENGVLQIDRREIFFERTAVDDDFACAGRETNAGDCCFAAAGGVVKLGSCHRCSIN